MSPDNLKKRGKFWHYRFEQDGREFRGSTKESNVVRAKEFLDTFKTGIRQRTINPHVGKSPFLAAFSVSFLKFIDETTTAGHLADKTRKSYRNGCRLLSATRIWNMRLNEITTEEAATLRFPGSGSNANQALRTLRRILSYAKKRGLLWVAPTINLVAENERTTLVEPWLEDLLLEHASPTLRAAIIIGLDAVVRPFETCAMRWEDVLWDRKLIFIPKSKSRKGRRYVGITERMRVELEAIKARQELSLRGSVDGHADGSWSDRPRRKPTSRQPLTREQVSSPARAISEWVFPSTGGKSGRKAACGHILAGSLDKMWTMMRAKVLVSIAERNLPPWPEGLVLYSCRHTGATDYSDMVGNIAKVSDLLGHADPRTTRRYLHHQVDSAEVMDSRNQKRAKLAVVKKRA